nr:hypothetical protein MACL_00002917 [Theileria orientalis]
MITYTNSGDNNRLTTGTRVSYNTIVRSAVNRGHVNNRGSEGNIRVISTSRTPLRGSIDSQSSSCRPRPENSARHYQNPREQHPNSENRHREPISTVVVREARPTPERRTTINNARVIPDSYTLFEELKRSDDDIKKYVHILSTGKSRSTIAVAKCLHKAVSDAQKAFNDICYSNAPLSIFANPLDFNIHNNNVVMDNNIPILFKINCECNKIFTFYRYRELENYLEIFYSQEMPPVKSEIKEERLDGELQILFSNINLRIQLITRYLYFMKSNYQEHIREVAEFQHRTGMITEIGNNRELSKIMPMLFRMSNRIDHLISLVSSHNFIIYRLIYDITKIKNKHLRISLFRRELDNLDIVIRLMADYNNTSRAIKIINFYNDDFITLLAKLDSDSMDTGAVIEWILSIRIDHYRQTYLTSICPNSADRTTRVEENNAVGSGVIQNEESVVVGSGVIQNEESVVVGSGVIQNEESVVVGSGVIQNEESVVVGSGVIQNEESVVVGSGVIQNEESVVVGSGVIQNEESVVVGSGVIQNEESVVVGSGVIQNEESVVVSPGVKKIKKGKKNDADDDFDRTINDFIASSNQTEQRQCDSQRRGAQGNYRNKYQSNGRVGKKSKAKNKKKGKKNNGGQGAPISGQNGSGELIMDSFVFEQAGETSEVVPSESPIEIKMPSDISDQEPVPEEVSDLIGPHGGVKTGVEDRMAVEVTPSTSASDQARMVGLRTEEESSEESERTPVSDEGQSPDFKSSRQQTPSTSETGREEPGEVEGNAEEEPEETVETEETEEQENDGAPDTINYIYTENLRLVNHDLGFTSGLSLLKMYNYLMMTGEYDRKPQEAFNVDYALKMLEHLKNKVFKLDWHLGVITEAINVLIPASANIKLGEDQDGSMLKVSRKVLLGLIHDWTTVMTAMHNISSLSDYINLMIFNNNLSSDSLTMQLNIVNEIMANVFSEYNFCSYQITQLTSYMHYKGETPYLIPEDHCNDGNNESEERYERSVDEQSEELTEEQYEELLRQFPEEESKEQPEESEEQQLEESEEEQPEEKPSVLLFLYPNEIIWGWLDGALRNQKYSREVAIDDIYKGVIR